MAPDVAGHVPVPVADEADARATAELLAPYRVDRVTDLHVVETEEGVSDETPAERSERLAAAAFAAFRSRVPAVETTMACRRNVVTAILEVAAAVGATATAVRPRGGSRLRQFPAGDRALGQLTAADRPVVSLPRPSTA